MAENPLLPHRKLQELYTLIGRCRKLETQRGASGGREAVLAGTSIHLESGDYFSAPAGDPAAVLVPESPSGHALSEGFSPSVARLLAVAAMARGLQLSGSGRIVLALTGTGSTEASWTEALTWAQTDKLPFILCVTDIQHAAKSRSRTKGTLRWPDLNSVCESLLLPTLTVDGEDAVAMFRVTQEAVLRARSGYGPSVIWAIGSAEPPAGEHRPLQRLRRYMMAREIPLPR